jgi:hypothetical protein
VQDVMNTLPHLELGLPPDFGIDDDHLDDIGWA